MRFIYMGSPDFAVKPLEHLIAKGFRPEAIFSRPDKPKGRGGKMQPTAVKAAALALDIPVFTPANINSPEAIEQIKQFKPELLVVVAYGQILKKELLALPPKGSVNLHASLLPAYRGAAPIQRAIMNGETLSGITTMYLAEGLDSGDMILKAEVAISPEDTGGSLHDKLADTGSELLAQTLALIAADQVKPIAQNHDLATYAALLTADDEIINWQLSAQTIYNQIRGLNPFPKAYTYYKQKRLKVLAAIWRPKRFEATAGQIVAIDRQGIWLATADGEICLTEVQPEGKAKMEASAFARGSDIAVGMQL